jgi:hypothetical protein
MKHFLYIGIIDEMGIESMIKIDLPDAVDTLSDMLGIIPDDMPKQKYSQAHGIISKLLLRARFGTEQNRRPYKVNMPEKLAKIFISGIGSKDEKELAERLKKLSTFKWIEY